MKNLSPRKLLCTKGKLSVINGGSVEKYLYDWQLRMGYKDVIEVNLLERDHLLDYTDYVKELQAEIRATSIITVNYKIFRPSIWSRFISFVQSSARLGSSAGDNTQSVEPQTSTES